MKTIPSIRIKPETEQNMLRAIDKFNKENISKLSISSFRRLALEFLSKFILQNKEKEIKKTLHIE